MILLDALSLAGGALGGLYDFFSGERNYKNEQEQQAYEREQLQIARGREDTAVQRRVADLKAAGLSPVLAAGSSAQTMGPIKQEAPGRDYSLQNKLASSLALMRAKQEIARSDAEIAYTVENSKALARNNRINDIISRMRDEQGRSGEEVIAFNNMQGIQALTAKQQQDARHAYISASDAERNLQWYEDHRIPSSLSGVPEQMANNDYIANVLKLSKEGGPFASAALSVLNKLVTGSHNRR